MASFSRFPELPLELQDLVWEFYLLSPSQPTAHFGRLKLKCIFTDESARGWYRPILYRIAPPSGITGAYLGYDHHKTLLQTSSRSRAISLRLPDASTPPDSALLLKERKGPFPLPSLRIDISNDLVIFEQGYHTERPGPVDHTEEILYIAVVYDIRNDSDCCELADSFSCLIEAYWDVYVFYVAVDPDVLRQCENLPWRERTHSHNFEFSLEEYLAAYTESKRRPGGFMCGNREYFEVPAEKIPRLGGLCEAIYALDCARRSFPNDNPPISPTAAERLERYQPFEPRSFRLMTWRDL